MKTLVASMLLCAAAGAAAQTDDAAASFSAIELSGSAHVTLRQGPRDRIRLPADADARRAVETRVSDGRLLIRTRDSWKFWASEKPRIEVQMRELRRLVISGASDVHAVGPFKAEEVSVSISGAGLVRLDDLRADSLRFVVSGAGDGEMAGQVRELRLSVSGKGKLAAEKLKAARASVSISGVGHADLWVTDELKIAVSGIGSVNYWGTPSVTRSNAGMASVEAMGPKP